MQQSYMTQKGQVTIPASLRQALKLGRGSKVSFVQQGDAVLLRAVVEPDTASVFGLLKARKGRGVKDVDAALDQLRRGRA